MIPFLLQCTWTTGLWYLLCWSVYLDYWSVIPVLLLYTVPVYLDYWSVIPFLLQCTWTTGLWYLFCYSVPGLLVCDTWYYTSTHQSGHLRCILHKVKHDWIPLLLMQCCSLNYSSWVRSLIWKEQLGNSDPDPSRVAAKQHFKNFAKNEILTKLFWRNFIYSKVVDFL